MKKLSALAVLALLTYQLSFCAEPERRVDSTFQRLEGYDKEITVPGIWFRDRYCLTPGVVLAFGAPTYPAQCYLYAIDTERMDTIYVSEYWESDYGYELYQWRTEEHAIVLWESPTEHCSILECFVLDVRSREFRNVGVFDLTLPIPEGADGGNDYPVDQIHIKATDTVVTFRYPRQLEIAPCTGEGHQKADSAIYELELRADSLKLVYPRK